LAAPILAADPVYRWQYHKRGPVSRVTACTISHCLASKSKCPWVLEKGGQGKDDSNDNGERQHASLTGVGSRWGCRQALLRGSARWQTRVIASEPRKQKHLVECDMLYAICMELRRQVPVEGRMRKPDNKYFVEEKSAAKRERQGATFEWRYASRSG
jgi:hypothetical protein